MKVCLYYIEKSMKVVGTRKVWVLFDMDDRCWIITIW